MVPIHGMTDIILATGLGAVCGTAEHAPEKLRLSIGLCQCTTSVSA